MDSKLQSRFFFIMSCYDDDERIAAHAIVDFTEAKEPPEQIYKDLLSSKYKGWVDALEDIADRVLWKDLQKYCKDKDFQLSMMRSNIWSCGDNAIIERTSFRV